MKSLKLFLVFFLFFLGIFFESPHKVSATSLEENPIYVKDVLRVIGSTPNLYFSKGTGFIIEKPPLSSEESLSQNQSLKGSDLLFVTNFHNACCDPLGSFFKLSIEPDIESVESVELNQVCGFSVEDDLIVFCLDDNFPIQTLIESSKNFNEKIRELSQLENDSSIYSLGFSFIRNHYLLQNGRKKERSSILSKIINRSPLHNSFTLIGQSIGYSPIFMRGLSGSPILDVKNTQLKGIYKTSNPTGLLTATTSNALENILKSPLDCDNTFGYCINLALMEAFQRAQNGKADSQFKMIHAEFLNSTRSWLKIMCLRGLYNLPYPYMGDLKEICAEDGQAMSHLKKEWLLKLAQSGFAEAQHYFYLLYFDTDKDFSPYYLLNWSRSARLNWLALSFLQSSFEKNFLKSKYIVKMACALTPLSTPDPNWCLKESSSDWNWLKALADFGHIMAQEVLGVFFTCGTQASFTDCDNKKARDIFENQLCKNNKDLQEIKFLKENPNDPFSKFINNFHPLDQKIINEVYNKYFGSEDGAPGICARF